jgi:hypothetical protein
MRKLTIGSAALLAAMIFSPQAKALTTAFVDFETTPTIAQGPSLFSAAGSSQDITVPGVASFLGGVVLGDETNLPALSFGTSPNVYGTASTSVIPLASTTLQSSVTVTIDPSYTVDEISFPLFNGMQAVESYTVDAFNGTTPIGSQDLSDLATNEESGHGVIDLKATNITSVTITPGDLSAGWDFSVDSVAFNEPVSSAVTPGGTIIPPSNQGTGTGTTTTGVVPLPAAVWSALPLLTGLGIIRGMRKASAA